MAILHGEYFLELIIIFILGLTSGSPLIKVFNLEDMELKESVVLNGFSGIVDDSQTGSKCDIGNSSCGFHDMKKLVLCEEELKGIGSLNTSGQLNTSLQFDNDVLITGEGNLEILSHVSVGSPFAGCLISINISGDLLLAEYASLLAGTLIVRAGNLFLQNNSFLKTTALGGAPPPKRVEHHSVLMVQVEVMEVEVLAALRVMARIRKILGVEMLMLGLLLRNPGVMEAGVGQQVGKANLVVGEVGVSRLLQGAF